MATCACPADRHPGCPCKILTNMPVTIGSGFTYGRCATLRPIHRLDLNVRTLLRAMTRSAEPIWPSSPVRKCNCPISDAVAPWDTHRLPLAYSCHDGPLIYKETKPADTAIRVTPRGLRPAACHRFSHTQWVERTGRARRAGFLRTASQGRWRCTDAVANRADPWQTVLSRLANVSTGWTRWARVGTRAGQQTNPRRPASRDRVIARRFVRYNIARAMHRHRAVTHG